MVSRNQKLAYAAIIFFVLVIVVSPAVMSQTQTQKLGFRDEFQPLSQDNVLHYIVLQNPKNKKYFLRMAVQNPEHFLGLKFVPNPMEADKIKAVRVMARGTTSIGSSFTRSVPNVKVWNPAGPDQSSWGEYFLHHRQLMPQNGLRFDYIAVDLELKFPSNATNADMRRSLRWLAQTNSIELVDSTKFWPRVDPVENSVFLDSIDSIFPKT